MKSTDLVPAATGKEMTTARRKTETEIVSVETMAMEVVTEIPAYKYFVTTFTCKPTTELYRCEECITPL